MSTKHSAIEAAAKGMALDQDGDGAWPHDWDAADQNQYRNLARAAILALRQWMDAEGLVCVPREATDDMQVAGTEDWLCERAMEDRALACWKAMIAAAPDALGDTHE